MPARKLYHTEEERREARKRTLAKYDRSEKGRAAQHRASRSPSGQARYARYRETEGYVAAQERYHTSDKARATAQEAGRRARLIQPERIAARYAVQSAIRRRVLAKPECCFVCLLPKRLDAHHHLGYEPTHWLDVLWLCRRCHKAAHAVTATA